MNSKDLHLFVDKVDAKLFKCVEFENLEASNIQDTNEVDFLHGRINQGIITHVHQITEKTSKYVLDDGGKTNSDCIQVLGLVDPLSSNLRNNDENALYSDLLLLLPCILG